MKTIQLNMSARILIAALWWVAGMCVAPAAFAQHEGHDHGHGAEAAPIEEAPEELTVENHSAKYEALLKYFPVEPGEPLEMKLFLSHYDDNSPLDSAMVEVSNAGLPEQKFTVKETDPGVYVLSTTMPEEKVYDFNVIIRSASGDDFISLPDTDLSHHHEEAHAAEDDHAHSWMYAVAAGIILLGFLLGWWLGKRSRSGRGKAFGVLTTLLMLPALTPDTLNAQHEGHDHGPQAAATQSLSSEFRVPKETQFLLGIRTLVAGHTSFDTGRRIYGTIVPASGRQAVIHSPQAGRFLEIMVRPGEHVEAGQVLATVERILDATSDIDFQAERNRLDAEYEAARKEYERLKSLSDIASKKSLEEAEARYLSSKANKELFQSNVKVMTLRAPISGVVAPFVWSKGATVNPAESMFAVNDLRTVNIEAQAFERDVEAITAADRYMVQCADKNHEVKEVSLLSLGQEFNSSNQSQKVLFELNNQDSHFKLGEFVNVWVYKPTGTTSMSVPNSAITEVEGRPVIFVKKAAERYELRYVAVGENNGVATEIKGGLEPGEHVVSEGAYQVKLVYLNQ